MRTTALFLLALGLSAGAVASQTEIPRPLLSVQERFRALGGQQFLTHRDFVVAADGTTLGRTCNNNLGGFGWVAQNPIRATPPRSALTDLVKALAEAKVGLLPASCQLLTGLPETGTASIAWYGAGRRFHQIQIEINGASDPARACPPEVASLLTAVDAFLFRVPGVASAIGVETDENPGND